MEEGPYAWLPPVGRPSPQGLAPVGREGHQVHPGQGTCHLPVHLGAAMLVLVVLLVVLVQGTWCCCHCRLADLCIVVTRLNRLSRKELEAVQVWTIVHI